MKLQPVIQQPEVKFSKQILETKFTKQQLQVKPTQGQQKPFSLAIPIQQATTASENKPDNIGSQLQPQLQQVSRSTLYQM
jgi:hypothetical protein